MFQLEELEGGRAELEAILRSGTLNRAPHLVSFLRYVCERYFEGRSDQIKEYTIAVEAFGRSPGFDPKKDSIVRVEAHRLRRRLSEYYASAGAHHTLRIVIPNGQYIPQFIVQNGLEKTIRDSPPLQTAQLEVAFDTPEHPAELATDPAAAPQKPQRKLPRLWLRLACAVALSAICALLVPHLLPIRTKAAANEVWAGPWSGPVAPEFRMLSGYHGPAFTDRQGHMWVADAYFTGGHSQPVITQRKIEGLTDPALMKAQRSGAFHYDIPLGKGSYELHLYFAETEYGPGNPRGGGDASRTMHVSINGARRLPDFDPLAESGAPNRLHVRVFKDISPANDGKLHIGFESGTGAAFVNGIEILASQPGVIRPVRLVTQDRPVTDVDGRIWSADEYFYGGVMVSRRNPVLGEPQKMLYRGERYGHFTYHIPLAPGKYRLTLHFAETWFGTPESGLPGLGSRVFNVFANGVALLQNFEIATHVGLNRPFTAAFDDVQPNAQGVLCLEFVPIKNYAEVNAIEVLETE